MASRTADPAEELTQQHRSAQVAIAAETVRQVAEVWPLLDPLKLDRTSSRWIDTAVNIITTRYHVSRALAQSYLHALRTMEIGLAAAPSVPLIEPSEAAIRTSLLVTGPIGIKERTKTLATAPVEPRSSTPVLSGIERASRAALVDVAGVAMRHTLAGGRDAIATTVKHDPRAIGYVRRSDGDPCYFCAMLISRGPVYKSSSFASSDPRFVGDGEFKAHDHDGCTLRPVYSDKVQLDDVARYQQIWNQHAAGKSGNEAVNAFRHAYNLQRRSPTAEPARAVT